MIKYCIAFLMLFGTLNLIAQNELTAKIVDATTKKILPGATALLVNTSNGASANTFGIVQLKNIPNGTQLIKFSFLGKESFVKELLFPLASTDTIIIELKGAEPIKQEDVVIQSTRSSRTIKNNPTRMEVIDAEEVEEKSNMRPANVSMVLHESTGIQVQQTSATSGNASIRVQGLDGRYTQLLKDGYPNFGNFASGLSLLEIPPLDVKQVEVIKGPASTLYGGGAIAGVVNFISKVPKSKAELNAIFNQSNIGQTNLGVYSAQRKVKFGYTLLALYNKQLAYDVDKDDFSEVPKSDNFTVNPRFFYFPNEKSTLLIGNSFSQGKMIGGDMFVITGKSDANHTYFEKNRTTRNTTTVELTKNVNERNNIKIKQSLSLFDRTIDLVGYTFSGFNTNVFTDASHLYKKGKHTIVSGINFMYDNFKDNSNRNLDTRTTSAGAYTQHTYDLSDLVKLESGLRLDQVFYSNNNFRKNQTFLLPRVSALFKISDKLNARLGGGLGYKIPTIFTEETESSQYKDILALNNVESERSYGGTFDVNYRTSIGESLSISVNQMCFYTQINKPLILQGVGSAFAFANQNKPVKSRGFETNFKFIYKEDLKLFVGYTFTNARATYLSGNQFLTLLPKNKLNLTLLYEKEDNFKLGLEGYMTDKQYLSTGTQSPLFWEYGFMAEKTLWEHFSFFINFENFTDTRQSRYKRVVNAPYNNPTFDQIWTHTEGFIFNGGIKFKF